MLNRWMLVLLLITGCGSFNRAPRIYNANPDFGAYTNAYIEYKDRYLDTSEIYYAIDVIYGHLPRPTVGQCQRYLSKYHSRTIVIDYTYWQAASDEMRLELMFHELAHCDLNCGHQDDVSGIMNTKMSRSYMKDSKIEAMFLECK